MASYTVLQQIGPVHVVNKWTKESPNIGLTAMLLPFASDHEELKTYSSLSEVENDFDPDSDIWKAANAYFQSNAATVVMVMYWNTGYTSDKPTANKVTTADNSATANLK